jgi:hypothetical protein
VPYFRALYRFQTASPKALIAISHIKSPGMTDTATTS